MRPHHSFRPRSLIQALSVLALVVVALYGRIAAAPSTAPAAVRLVLLVVVDQFRYDYLTRFRTDYVGGIRRLVTDGAVFTNANLEHYPTVTAVGHATMLSGATPAVSGIIGNDWFDRQTGATVTSVSDQTVTPLGAPSGSAASPRRLLVTTIGDELKMATGKNRPPESVPRVFGISLKDRAAILPVGRGADAAYWWDPKTGAFVTSTYYRDELPAWVQAFNERHLADGLAGKVWTTGNAEARVLGRLPPDRGPALYDAIYGSPYGNDLLLDFALELLDRERLGGHETTDLLSVSFSSNDAVGHQYGPESAEVQDITLKTDRVIGRLLDGVERAIGLQHVLVVFTSDHGVAPVPAPQPDGRPAIPGGRIASADLFGPIQQALAARFGEGQWLLSTAGSSPYLNYQLAAERQIDLAALRRVAAEAAVRVPHVARVYTRDELASGSVAAERFSTRIANGFNPQRSGDLEILLEPFWMRQAQGTTHGTPYNYDTHIPLILMGPGVVRGSYAAAVALNDLAPTLATLLNVETPAGSSGRVLTGAIVTGPLLPR